MEKSGTGFQRVNSSCNEYGVIWNYRKDNYGFLFDIFECLFADFIGWTEHIKYKLNSIEKTKY